MTKLSDSPEYKVIAELNRLKRAEAWRIRNEKVEAIRAAFRALKPNSVAQMYAIRDNILSPGDYGRRAKHS